MGIKSAFVRKLSNLEDLLKLLPIASLIRSKSYSQFWEDRLISRNIVPEIGSYVDIGAGTPIWGSNTYYFYRRGWAGVTLDPITFNINMQKRFRPRDKQYETVVSSNPETIEFYQLSPWELSTIDSKIAYQRIAAGNKLIAKTYIKPTSLEAIYRENPIKRPAILSIDVEGAEMDVLNSNNWEIAKPDIICIEELENPLSYSKIRGFLTLQDYELIAYNGVSSIYIWKETKHRRS